MLMVAFVALQIQAVAGWGLPSAKDLHAHVADAVKGVRADVKAACPHVPIGTCADKCIENSACDSATTACFCSAGFCPYDHKCITEAEAQQKWSVESAEVGEEQQVGPLAYVGIGAISILMAGAGVALARSGRCRRSVSEQAEEAEIE
eukprot:796428-Amphidinium_carterae.2